MSDNYVLSGLWLAATFGGLGYFGYTSTVHRHAEHVAHAETELKADMMSAIRAANGGRYAEAARAFERLQAKRPQSTTIALNLGIAYSALEMYPQAEQQFAKVLAANPEDWDAVAERAVLRAVQGDESGGLELLESIPKGKGQLDKRLVADPVWLKAKDQMRLEKLRDKHDVPDFGDTSAKRLREMERRRAEFEAANRQRAEDAEAKDTP